jgi:hypothetical protein
VVKTMLVALLFAVLCPLSSCRHRIREIVIESDPPKIGPEWVQIALPPSVKAEWQYQTVRLILTTKFALNINPSGIRLEDGSVTLPEADLIADSGAKHTFACGGYERSDGVGVECFSADVPRGTHFVQLRLRSSQPIILSKIIWISYMPQDTKDGIP